MELTRLKTTTHCKSRALFSKALDKIGAKLTTLAIFCILTFSRIQRSRHSKSTKIIQCFLGEKFDNVCIFDLDSLCDLVGVLVIRFVRFCRRFSREKCPTLTVASFFFVRLQSHSDWATFLTIDTTKTTSIRPSPVSGN